MLEDFVKWFNPEHAEAGRKLLTHMLARIEALEGVAANKPASLPPIPQTDPVTEPAQ